jgi:ElaB/YqjD/DUF883 family membrane-anchored ribosome-binding protein
MDISNAKRATWAEAALAAWRVETGQKRSDSDAQDLIYDLLLLLESEGHDALDELEEIRENFESEKRMSRV